MVKPPTAKTVMKMGMSSFSFPANILPSLAQKAVIIPVCIISSKAPPMRKIKKMISFTLELPRVLTKAMGISSGETGDDST